MTKKGCVIWEPCMSVPDFMAIRPLVVKIFY